MSKQNREWTIEGRVIKGKKVGKKIGFPTCNLKLNDYIVPRLGVYAVNVKGPKFEKKGGEKIGSEVRFWVLPGNIWVKKRSLTFQFILSYVAPSPLSVKVSFQDLFTGSPETSSRAQQSKTLRSPCNPAYRNWRRTIIHGP